MAGNDDTPERPILTRAQAMTSNLSKYFTGKPCPKGHIEYRWTINATCLLCHSANVERWHAANAGKVLEIKRRHSETSKARETNRIASARVRVRNPGKATAWKQANPERARELNRISAKKHPDTQTAKTAARRAAILKATPRWADKEAIARVYAECARVTHATGIQHHVDHIVPLCGKNVRGLHVHYNLQILEASANHRKGNRLMDIAA